MVRGWIFDESFKAEEGCCLNVSAPEVASFLVGRLNKKASTSPELQAFACTLHLIIVGGAYGLHDWAISFKVEATCCNEAAQTRSQTCVSVLGGNTPQPCGPVSGEAHPRGSTRFPPDLDRLSLVTLKLRKPYRCVAGSIRGQCLPMTNPVTSPKWIPSVRGCSPASAVRSSLLM